MFFRNVAFVFSPEYLIYITYICIYIFIYIYTYIYINLYKYIYKYIYLYICIYIYYFAKLLKTHFFILQLQILRSHCIMYHVFSPEYLIYKYIYIYIYNIRRLRYCLEK